GKFLWCDVRPVLASVPGQLDEAVVGPSPDFILRDGRFDNSEDGVVVLRAGVVFVDGTARDLLLALVVVRQVVAYGFLLLAAIRGLDRKSTRLNSSHSQIS